MHFLTVDIISAFKKTVYGHAGDPVKIIDDRGDVVIVEDSEGYKFSVLKTELRDENGSLPVTTPAPESIPNPPKTTIPTLKETKKKNNGRASLF